MITRFLKIGGMLILGQPCRSRHFRRFGVTCFDDAEPGKLQAAAWAYLDNSVGVAMIEWVVTNPENTPKRESKKHKNVRRLSQAKLLNGWQIEGEIYRYTTILAATNVQGLIKLFERQGFTKTDNGLTHLIFTED